MGQIGRQIKSFLGMSDAPAGDVQLPNESGRRDPKLPKESTATDLAQGWATLKSKGLVGKKDTSKDKTLSTPRSQSKR